MGQFSCACEKVSVFMSEEHSVYRIRHAFLLPLTLLLVLVCALAVVTFLKGTTTAQGIVLGAFILPGLILLTECLVRQITLYPDKIHVRKPLRNKELFYKDITQVDCVLAGKRALLSLQTEHGFLILSNAYASFPDLVNRLLEKVPQHSISDETRNMAQNPPVKSSDIISCWLAAILVALILFLQVTH